MAGQLIPPPELDPKSDRAVTPEMGVELWLDVLNCGEEFLLAGLRQRLGPDGDLAEGVRQNYARWLDEHDAMMRNMMLRLAERKTNGRDDAA